tara:strand:+ start:1992 stop:2729 length:738 start_codon:yes stop_codon:yes gene_type:complete
MATTTATLTLSSADLTGDALALSTTSTLTKAGTLTGLDQTTGVARKTLAFASSGVIDSTVLHRADDFTTDGGNKVYIKNTSTTASEYMTVYLSGDRAPNTSAESLVEIGRLYAGDFMFFPWNATSGVKETFTCVVGNTWAAGDTVVFDGVTVVAANTTVADIAAQLDAAQYPNWVTSVSSATVTFVARDSRSDLEIDTTEIVATTAGDGDLTIATTVEGTKSGSDIYVTPSVHTGMTLESVVIYE